MLRFNGKALFGSSFFLYCDLSSLYVANNLPLPNYWQRHKESWRENGAWLNALPVPSHGTLLGFESFRVVFAIRVGVDICIFHSSCSGGWKNIWDLHGFKLTN